MSIFAFEFVDFSGSDLVEYLIDNQLKKFVVEVKQERPDVLDKCRWIALQSSERLYDIYSSGKDPFFRPS